MMNHRQGTEEGNNYNDEASYGVAGRLVFRNNNNAQPGFNGKNKKKGGTKTEASVPPILLFNLRPGYHPQLDG